MTDWDSIKTNVENAGNVLSTSMATLRDAHGAAKLGVNVRTDITAQLAGMGLGHVPKELPTYQEELVRLYKRGTAIGDLIETLLSPGEKNDKKLVEQLGDSDVKYAEIIEQIRDLVGD